MNGDIFDYLDCCLLDVRHRLDLQLTCMRDERKELHAQHASMCETQFVARVEIAGT